MSATGRMPIAARRTFRTGFTVALALAAGYALALDLPFLPPLFALLLTAKPAAPPGLKGLLVLVLLLMLTLGVGVLLVPVFLVYPATGVMISAVGIWAAMRLSLKIGQPGVGTLVAMGFTVIPGLGTVDDALAGTIVQSMGVGAAVAIVCQWLTYPFFPEDPAEPQPAEAPTATTPDDPGRVAIRATLLVLPAFLLMLTDPGSFVPVVVFALLFAQEDSASSVRTAGRELVFSVLLAGLAAIAFWLLLKVNPTLWMFTLLMLLFVTVISARTYGAFPSSFTAPFWLNLGKTMLILLGPAVGDSANGKDVYTAFVVRIGLFIAVALYAWLTLWLLAQLRAGARPRPRQAVAGAV